MEDPFIHSFIHSLIHSLSLSHFLFHSLTPSATSLRLTKYQINNLKKKKDQQNQV